MEKWIPPEWFDVGVPEGGGEFCSTVLRMLAMSGHCRSRTDASDDWTAIDERRFFAATSEIKDLGEWRFKSGERVSAHRTWYKLSKTHNMQYYIRLLVPVSHLFFELNISHATYWACHPSHCQARSNLIHQIEISQSNRLMKRLNIIPMLNSLPIRAGAWKILSSRRKKYVTIFSLQRFLEAFSQRFRHFRFSF